MILIFLYHQVDKGPLIGALVTFHRRWVKSKNIRKSKGVEESIKTFLAFHSLLVLGIFMIWILLLPMKGRQLRSSTMFCRNIIIFRNTWVLGYNMGKADLTNLFIEGQKVSLEAVNITVDDRKKYPGELMIEHC